MAESRKERIVPIDQVKDDDLAKRVPDMGGWPVLSASGDPVGEVDTVLVDREAREPRYLDVALVERLTQDPEAYHVLIPIGCAWMDRDQKRVVLPDRAIAEKIAYFPVYDHQPITTDFEMATTHCIDPRGPSVRDDQLGYTEPYFDSDRFYGVSRAGHGDWEPGAPTDYGLRSLEAREAEGELPGHLPLTPEERERGL